MYKVLIAEDEMLVRTGIRASIDWEKFNMYVVDEAADGQTAWELYQQHQPDLVLTDIKMPFMDGIELIRKIRDTGSHTEIIILSCLDDFALAREAIRLGVSGYILKLTMTTAEMEEILENACHSLDKVTKTKTSSVAPANIYDILEHSLLSHLTYNIPSLSECLSTLREYSITIHPHDLVTALMVVDQYEQLQDLYQDSHGQLIQFSLLNIMNEILTKSGSGLVVHESGSRYLLLFYNENETRSFHLITGVLEEIRTVLKNYFNVTPHFCISEMTQDLSRLRILYQQCLLLDEQEFFLFPGSVNHYESSWKTTLCQALLTRTRHTLNAFMDPGFTSSFLLQPLEKQLREELSSKAVLNIFYDSYIVYLHNQCPSDGDSYIWVRDFLQTLSACKNYYEMLEQFVAHAQKLERLSRERMSCSREILQALQFLQNNYSRQITLNEVSNLVGLSPNYFSSIFKKELGTSFLEYLNRYRIEKSMKLLQNTSMKSYEIAYACGFSDEGYYGKTFKKFTGKTPNEYKKSCVFTTSDE